MADTQRSYAEIIALLNVTGGDPMPASLMRDIMHSLQPTFGSLYVTSSAETVIAVQDTFVKVAGTTALSNPSNVHKMDMPANNRLRYTGVSPRHMHIACSIMMTSELNNQVTRWRLYHYDASEASGATLVHSEVQRKVGTATDIGSTALHADVVMEENDYLELHVANGTGTGNITCDLMYLFALGMLV